MSSCWSALPPHRTPTRGCRSEQLSHRFHNPWKGIWRVKSDHLWWRLRMHSRLMAVKATNCTHLNSHLRRPVLPESKRSPPRQVRFWQVLSKYCRESFSQFRKIQRDWVWVILHTPNQLLPFDLRLMKPSLSSSDLSSMKPESVPSDTTSKTTAD